MGTNDQIHAALQTLRPLAIWNMSGTSYAGLVWTDGVQSKPTEQEILDVIVAQ